MLLLAIEAVHDGRSWEILIILVIIDESENYPSNYLIWALNIAASKAFRSEHHNGFMERHTVQLVRSTHYTRNTVNTDCTVTGLIAQTYMRLKR